MTLGPLNGTRTHPLTDVGWSELYRIAAKPLPRQCVNPGLVNRLFRGEFVKTVMLPSPYKTHKGKPLAHLTTTDKGNDAIAKHRADIISRAGGREFPVHLKGALANHNRRVSGKPLRG